MKRLLALLLLSPIAFARVDLHCESLEKLPEGNIRNQLIFLELDGFKVLEVYTIDPPLVRIKRWGGNNQFKTSTTIFLYGRGYHEDYLVKHYDEVTLDRETLKLEITEWQEDTKESQCQIIDNGDEMLKYYENKEKETREHFDKLRDEQLKKNKI